MTRATLTTPATTCRHCDRPAYAVWHLKALPHAAGIRLCQAHWRQCIGSHGRDALLIPAGALQPRRGDDDPQSPPAPAYPYGRRPRTAEGRD